MCAGRLLGFYRLLPCHTDTGHNLRSAWSAGWRRRGLLRSRISADLLPSLYSRLLSVWTGKHNGDGRPENGRGLRKTVPDSYICENILRAGHRRDKPGRPSSRNDIWCRSGCSICVPTRFVRLPTPITLVQAWYLQGYGTFLMLDR